LKELQELNKKIMRYKQKLTESHIVWLKTSEYNTIGGDYFNSTISNLEYIADLLVNLVSAHPVIAPAIAPAIATAIADDSAEKTPEPAKNT